MKAKVYNMQKEEVGSITLKDEIFGVEYNEPLIHEMVVAYNTNQRQGTKSTLTRSEVKGHAKKPWKQKHTGHARQGSTKGPQFIGGGVVFAPKPRDFSKKVNKFARRQAFLSALSQKLAQKELTILDEFVLAEVKTKKVQEFLDAFNFDKNTVVVLDKLNKDAQRASKNIPNANVTTYELVNIYDIVSNKNVVLTKNAVKKLEEVYLG